MWSFFALCTVAVVGTIAWLLRRYAAPSVPYIVLAATAYAWYVSLSIVLITPMDVATSLMSQPERGVSVLWQITYWSTQVGLCTASNHPRYCVRCTFIVHDSRLLHAACSNKVTCGPR